MRATDVLRAEHRVIEGVLEALEIVLTRPGEEIDPTLIDAILDFFEGFADRRHHAKEEDLLFPKLEERGFSGSHGPTACMRDEHVLGRRLVTALRNELDRWQGGSRPSLGLLKSTAYEYTMLLRDHIAKEDGILFPMADGLLTSDDETELMQAFDQLEWEANRDENVVAYLDFARQLCEDVGVDRPPLPDSHLCAEA